MELRPLVLSDSHPPRPPCVGQCPARNIFSRFFNLSIIMTSLATDETLPPLPCGLLRRRPLRFIQIGEIVFFLCPPHGTFSCQKLLPFPIATCCMGSCQIFFFNNLRLKRRGLRFFRFFPCAWASPWTALVAHLPSTETRVFRRMPGSTCLSHPSEPFLLRRYFLIYGRFAPFFSSFVVAFFPPPLPRTARGRFIPAP